METFLPNLREVKFEGMSTGAFTIDVERFYNVIEALVRGLYFKESEKKLFANLEFMWSALREPSTLHAPFEDFIRQTEQKLRKDYKGENPEVFAYALESLEEGKHGICRIRFTRGHPFMRCGAAFPSLTKPPELLPVAYYQGHTETAAAPRKTVCRERRLPFDVVRLVRLHRRNHPLGESASGWSVICFS